MPVELAQAVALQVPLQLLANIPTFADGVEVTGCDTALLDALQRSEHRAHLGQVGDRGAVLDHLLVQKMDAPKAPTLAAAWFALAGKYLPEQALAHTVAPDQAGAALVEGFAEVGK